MPVIETAGRFMLKIPKLILRSSMVLYNFNSNLQQSSQSCLQYSLNPILFLMIFNNLQVSNIFGSAYLSGNVLFSPTQQQILYTPLNNVVKKINLKNNESQILPFETPHQISHLTISTNGIVLIAIDKAGYAVIFNLKGYFTIAEFNFKGVVITAQFSQDGQLFAIAQDHGFIVYRSPCLYRTFEPFVLVKKYKNRHSANITTIRFSPDNRFLLTAGQDNIIYINNLFPVEGYVAISLEVHRYKIVGMYYSYDMKYIYSIDSGSNVYVWKWVTDYLTDGYKNLQASKKRKLANFRGQKEQSLKQQNQTFEQNGQSTVDKSFYSEFQKQVQQGRYIMAKKLIVTQPGEYLKRVFYNPSNGFFASAYSKGKFSIYKLLEEELTEVQTFSVGQNKISTLAVNSSATWICLGLKTFGQIIVWQWKSQSYIINQKGFIHETQAIHFNKHKLIATGTNDGKVKLWDKISGFCLATFQQHESQITDVKFSNKNTLFSSSLDGSVNAYDVVKYKKFRKFKPDQQCQLTCLQIDESEDIIFAGSFDPYEVFSWNVQTGNILQIVRGHTAPISCIKMASDKLITGSWDKNLKIHQVFARKLNVQSFEHSSQITVIAVHPNKKQCAAATMKGQIYIWDVQAGQLIGIIDSQIHGGRSYFSKISADNDKSSKYIKCLQYSTCGNYLFGGGKSKYLYIYDIKHRMLLQKICLTKNKDLQGTLQKLNSKYVKQGITTYEMTLEEQQIDSDMENYQKLPGAKKLDVSEIRMKLQVDVKRIIIINSKEIAVNTSFGVLLISSLSSRKEVFNPYELTPNLVPKMLPQLHSKKEFSSFLIVGLKLNMNIRKLISKIPLEYLNQTLAQIEDNKLVLILEKLVEKDITYRDLNWVQKIMENLSKNGKNIKESLPINLRASMEAIEEQVKIMGRNKSILQMGLLINHQMAQE